MKMEEKQNTYWSAIAKYFSGNASEEEELYIREQRKKDPDFEEAYLQARPLFQKLPDEETAYEPDVDSGWQRLHMKARMRAEEEKKEVFMPSLVSAPAQRRRFQWAVAASVVFLLTLGLWFSAQNLQTDLIEVQTALNETKIIDLPDGTRVSLNENSVFSYPENFLKENREVKLTGEAFFEVQKAEGKRFTVYAQNTKTEVIGTAFYLQAYPGQEVKIQVTEGKVAFAATETEEAVFLTPGQEAVAGKKMVVPVKQEIQDPNFQSWQNKKLVFNDTRLDQLVERLERYYDSSILIEDQGLHNCRFTVSFEDPELGEVLEIISLTANLTIEEKGGQYVISGTACK